jgi:hypothetical protein
MRVGRSNKEGEKEQLGQLGLDEERKRDLEREFSMENSKRT